MAFTVPRELATSRRWRGFTLVERGPGALKIVLTESLVSDSERAREHRQLNFSWTLHFDRTAPLGTWSVHLLNHMTEV